MFILSKQIFKRIVFSILLGAVAAGTSFAADTDDLLIRLQKTYPNIPFNKVNKTEVNDIYEAIFGNDLLYTEKSGTYFFPTMFNMKLQRNIGDERRAELTVVDFSALPVGDAIKIVVGDGSRQVAVFSDPNCSYCKKLEAELVKINNVTIFIYPVGILGADSLVKAQSIACAVGDKSKIWLDMMNKGVSPITRACGSHVPERNHELFKKLGFQGTPALAFKNGKVLKGYAEAAKIESMLSN